MKTKEFPYTPFERIAKNAGAKRISAQATRTLRNLVLEYAEEKAFNIVAVTRHAGRKTIKKDDVLFVTKKD